LNSVSSIIKKIILFPKYLIQKSYFFFLFAREFKRFKKISRLGQNRFHISWNDRFPFLNEKTPVTYFDTQYIYHTAWAARILSRILPASHVVISSTLYFSSIISSFITVQFYDYRPANLQLHNLISKAALNHYLVCTLLNTSD